MKRPNISLKAAAAFMKLTPDQRLLALEHLDFGNKRADFFIKVLQVSKTDEQLKSLAPLFQSWNLPDLFYLFQLITSKPLELADRMALPVWNAALLVNTASPDPKNLARMLDAAASMSRADLVETMVKSGPDLDTSTALKWAVNRKNPQMVQFLLGQPQDETQLATNLVMEEAIFRHDMVAFEGLLPYYRPELDKDRSLIRAIRVNNPDFMQALLKQADPIDPSAVICAAIDFNRQDMALELIKRYPPTPKDHARYLQTASCAADGSFARVLLQEQDIPSSRIKALMWAAGEGLAQAIRVLWDLPPLVHPNRPPTAPPAHAKTIDVRPLTVAWTHLARHTYHYQESGHEKIVKMYFAKMAPDQIHHFLSKHQPINDLVWITELKKSLAERFVLTKEVGLTPADEKAPRPKRAL